MFLPAVWLGLATLASQPAPQPLSLDAAVREALAHNPELAQARASIATGESNAAVARALPEPMFTYQAWQQPLAHPFDPTATNMHMFGLQQSLPFPGQLGLAGKAAETGVAAQRADAGAVRLKVEAQVAHALVTDWLQAQEIEVHLGHMALAQQTLEAVRSRFVSGAASQGDVLRAETDLHRLHSDIAGLQANLKGTEALLNALMGRMPGSFLQPAAEPETEIPGVAHDERPEVRAARRRAEQASQTAALADRARRAPDLMVGLTYMLMPGMPDSYMVMAQVGLPWISARRKAEAERAERQEAEARLATAAAENAARYEIEEARARALAARAELNVLEKDVTPGAEHTLEATRSSYVAGGADLLALLDAESVLLDTRLTVLRQRAALGDAVADLRRALAIDLLPEDKP